MTPLELIASKLGQKVFPYLLIHENEQFYIRELARLLQTDPTNLSRFLRTCKDIGLIKGTKRGTTTLIQLQTAHPAYTDMKGLITKTIGVPKAVTSALTNISGIQEAYLYGSWVKKTENAASDIDLFIVGHVNETDLLRELHKLERTLGREVNYMLMTTDEFSKKKRGDSFVRGVLTGPKEKLI